MAGMLNATRTHREPQRGHLNRLSEWENLFYNLPGCSGPVHGFSGVACKTLPFEIVEKTI